MFNQTSKPRSSKTKTTGSARCGPYRFVSSLFARLRRSLSPRPSTSKTKGSRETRPSMESTSSSVGSSSGDSWRRVGDEYRNSNVNATHHTDQNGSIHYYYGSGNNVSGNGNTIVGGSSTTEIWSGGRLASRTATNARSNAPRPRFGEVWIGGKLVAKTTTAEMDNDISSGLSSSADAIASYANSNTGSWINGNYFSHRSGVGNSGMSNEYSNKENTGNNNLIVSGNYVSSFGMGQPSGTRWQSFTLG